MLQAVAVFVHITKLQELLNLNKPEASTRIKRKFLIMRQSIDLQSAKSISLQSILMLRFTPRISKWSFPHFTSWNSEFLCINHNPFIIRIHAIILQQIHTSILKLVYIYTYIYIYVQWNSASFGQPYGHLQRCKIQSSDTFKKVQN